MEKGLSYLVGTHDFRNLCKMDVANGVVTFVRTILEARLEVAEGESVEQGQGYRMMAVVLRGSGFLWHQVRCVVGVLLLVGRGLEQPEVLRDLLDTERHPARPGYLMASEQPLCLFECEYELETIWRCDRGARDALVRGLQRQWVELGTRAALVRAMLHRLECDEEQPQPQPQLSAALTPGQAARSHTPLHLRQTCATLQDRIRHFTAKGRIACTPAPPAAHSECSNIKQ